MKKIIAFLMIFGSVSVFAADSYLYWLVNIGGKVDDYRPEGGIGSPQLYAKIKQVVDDKTSSYLYIYDSAGNQIGTQLGYDDAKQYTDFGMGLFAQLAYDDAKSFVVEVWASQGDGKAPAAVSSLDYALAGSYITSGGLAAPASMAEFAVSVPIPEPNSGLLMLIGASVLALRRKKLQKKA